MLGVFLLVSSYDLLSVYLSIEFLSLIFYTLPPWKRDSGFSAEAGLKYFIFGSLASFVFIRFFASLLLNEHGSGLSSFRLPTTHELVNVSVPPSQRTNHQGQNVTFDLGLQRSSYA